MLQTGRGCAVALNLSESLHLRSRVNRRAFNTCAFDLRPSLTHTSLATRTSLATSRIPLGPQSGRNCILERRQNRSLSLAKSTGWGLPEGWEAVIGVECHAQLKGPTKLFSATLLPTLQSEQNTLASPFDAAHPGTMPGLQRTAVDKALRAALILQCDVAEISRFDRKHYFYPDLAPGYQITQKYAPLAKNGRIQLRHDEGYLAQDDPEVSVEIEQLQLEQDTAKSSHLAAGDSVEASDTYVDLNRSGAGLIEIVSGPQLRTPSQAGAYIRKLQELLRRVGASDGNMDEGSLRCDVNVSIRRKGAQQFGTRCEVKNVNSVRFVEKAIASEVLRQHAILERGEKVEQQTRGYDEETGHTKPLRSKEDASDYRYMPDPNLPALKIRRKKIESLLQGMPEHPDNQRPRLMEQYGLSIRDVNVLMRIGLEEVGAEDGEAMAEHVQRAVWTLASPGEAVEYFELLVKHGCKPKPAANWIIHDLLKTLNVARSQQADSTAVAKAPPPAMLAELLKLSDQGRITGTSAKTLLPELVARASSQSDGDREVAADEVLTLARSRNLLADDDAEKPGGVGRPNDGTNTALPSLELLCQRVLAERPDEVTKFRAGKEKVLNTIIGEVLKRSKGKADGKATKQILLNLLRAP